MKILVMSCDKNNDLWEPFHILTEKYWPDHPEIYYLTETLDNPYYKTIKKDYPITSWSRRVCDATKEIDDNKIFITCDDLFLSGPVDTKKLLEMIEIVDENTGSLNLHKQFSPTEQVINPDVQLRPKGALYNCSVMCSVWWKDNLIKVFNVDLTPWDFEKTVDDLGLNYYVYNHDHDFLTFRNNNYFMFGLWRGKWSFHAYKLLTNEGIRMDFNRRGFCGK